MTRFARRALGALAVAGAAIGLLAGAAVASASRDEGGDRGERGEHAVVRAAIEPGKITSIMVVELENTNFSTTYGPGSPAVYLNSVLVPKGHLIEQYYATSHVSQGNYISQISGQASTVDQNDDCIDLASLRTPPVVGAFTDVVPATPAALGQVVGNGCVFPASVKTIADQLDARYGGHGRDDDDRSRYPWRAYLEDMGNDPARDYGTPDPLGGTTCAHPPIGGVDNSNTASPIDGYATRHNPFVYFHSIIDDQARCDERVVPLGTVDIGENGAPDVFSGHLALDLARKRTTPRFSFVVPNLCNDAHDTRGCAGPDIENGSSAGLAAADKWLKHWMPLILDSPAYRSGELLVVITFDEANFDDARGCCGEVGGPNNANPGFSRILGLFGLQAVPTLAGQYPGGGQVGALLLNRKHVIAGSRNTTGSYNHYSALRSYEDILGIRSGGTDGLGHLGFAAAPGLQPFGTDVFPRGRR